MAHLAQVVFRALTGGDLLDQIAQQRPADPTGCAEAAALVCEEGGEVADHVEQVAAVVEDHEGAGGRQVFEGDDAIEVRGREGRTRGTRDLNRLGILRPAVGQDLMDRRAERILVDTGACAVSADRKDLTAGGLVRAFAAEPIAAPLDHARGGEKGLDIVHHGRLIVEAAGHREGRALARDTALALERLDQRRLLAADVGARTQVDLDVEVEAVAAENPRAEQALGATALQHRVEMRQEVTILAAQIEEAPTGTDDPGADRHALDHQIGIVGQQDAILEGPGLALVRVADDVAIGPGSLATEAPFERRRETRPAAPAQSRAFHLCKRGVRTLIDQPTQRSAVGRRITQEQSAPTDVVFDPEELARPTLERDALLHQIGDPIDPLRIQVGHGLAVDQECGALVAHPGAGGETDARAPVVSDQVTSPRRQPRQPETLDQQTDQAPAAQHPVGDVVAETDLEGAARAVVQEGVEGDCRAHLSACDIQCRRQGIHRRVRHIGKTLLDADQMLKQVPRISAMGCKRLRHEPLDGDGCGRVHRHLPRAKASGRKSCCLMAV
jgi:hypothetical protein